MMLRHPLMIDHYVSLDRVERVNDQYRHKKAAAAEASRNGNWLEYIFLHERPYRPRCLEDVLPDVNNAALASELVAEVWIDSENVSQNQRVWRSVWRMLPQPWATMTQDEQKEFAALPDRFSIFRGYALPRGTALGLSWTLDRGRAEWFARRFAGEHHFVAVGIVRKKDVLAFFSRRDEHEIVVFPKVVDIVEREIEVARTPQC
jgi:hypothetical protein